MHTTLVPEFSTRCFTWPPAKDTLAPHGAHLGVSAKTDLQAYLILPRHPHAVGSEGSSKSTRGQLGCRTEEGPVSWRQLRVESSLLRGLGGATRSALNTDPRASQLCSPGVEGAWGRQAEPPPSVPEVGGSSSRAESTRAADRLWTGPQSSVRWKGPGYFYTDTFPTTPRFSEVGGIYPVEGSLRWEGDRGPRHHHFLYLSEWTTSSHRSWVCPAVLPLKEVQWGEGWPHACLGGSGARCRVCSVFGALDGFRWGAISLPRIGTEQCLGLQPCLALKSPGLKSLALHLFAVGNVVSISGSQLSCGWNEDNPPHVTTS